MNQDHADPKVDERTDGPERTYGNERTAQWTFAPNGSEELALKYVDMTDDQLLQILEAEGEYVKFECTNEDAEDGELSGAIRQTLLVRNLSPELEFALFNARKGLRGCFAESPNVGECFQRRLITKFRKTFEEKNTYPGLQGSTEDWLREGRVWIPQKKDSFPPPKHLGDFGEQHPWNITKDEWRERQVAIYETFEGEPSFTKPSGATQQQGQCWGRRLCVSGDTYQFMIRGPWVTMSGETRVSGKKMARSLYLHHFGWTL